ncbi:Protein CBG18724 [Caenorhabditis briggsae]|uniref:Protein CBG18724 n=1 Tax=Caenorhabditis briggsae TaxID=6238 RepID=B0K0A5_CAEBR|nr:Protein CBG18724 [Caenorhabditis briggsae]CAP36124.1 Protein CBG18724 [Caenorhabditis briggsae]
MTVVGIVPTGSDGTEILDDEEEFLVTVNTKCTYISRYYRIVFVLDLSPSVVVADDESNCCLVDRVIPSLRNSLRSSVKPFTIPGTRNVFRPQVFSSVCLFTPFMKFEETFSLFSHFSTRTFRNHDVLQPLRNVLNRFWTIFPDFFTKMAHFSLFQTLCQGVFVTESNVDQVIESVETKFVEIYKHLFTFSRPILELWGKLKRRHKHNKFDSLCENESDERTRRDAVKQTFQNRDIFELVISKLENPDEPALTESPGPAEKEAERDPNCSALNHGDGGDEDPPGMSIMDMKRGIWTATERKEDTKQLSFASDKSYVAPDWSLIFMLRMGLLQIQMLPENTQSTVFVKNNTQVILTLRLAFRPLVFIDYIITSAWPVNKNVHQAVNVELVLEGPYNELKDLLTESNYLNPVRMNLIKSVIDGIIDADRLLLHIHSFDTKIAYFTIPPGVTKEYALFMQGDSSRQLLPQLCIVKPDGVKTRGFVNFWKKMLEVDDGNWQKWVHTQTERCLLNLIHVPFEMFTTERILNFDTRYPLNAVLYSVKVRSTFCLVENQTYVTLVYATEKSKKPAYFFIRKVICRGPVAIVKTAFLGGVTSIERRRAVDAQRQRLINVTYGTILNEEDLRKEAVRYRYEANAAKLYMDPQKIYEKRFDPACTVYDSSGASLEQFIMFPAITIQPADDGTPILKRISRYEQKMMDKKNNKKDWYREVITKNSMPLAKANETLAIVCEMWNEPEGGNPDDQLANMSSQQRLHEDLRFISVLFTLDIIIRHSGHCNESENAPLATDGVIPSALNPSNTPNRVFPYEDRCRVTSVFELTGMPRRTLKMQDDAERKKKLYQKSRKRTERLKSTEQLEKEYDAEQAAITDVPKPPIPGTLPIRYIRKSTDGEDEMLAELDEPFPYLDSLKSPHRPLPTVTDIHADAVSNFVTVYSNLFSMTNLIYHAQRRYFPLPHFVLGVESTDRPRCNGLQLNALHCQLSEVSDLTWILDQTEQSIVFADLCKTIPDAEKPPPSRLRVYVKALTARMIAMIFVPVSESFDRQSEVIPMFIATCHETQIAHCYALNGFDEWGVVNLPMSDVPERWDSGARFGWTPNNRNVFPDEATTFKSFCDHFDNELLPRIRMRAMYEAAQEDIPLNEDRLMDLSQDVDFIEVEVSAIPLALKRVCRHLDLPDEPKIDKSSRKIPEIVVGNLTKPGEGLTEGKVEKSISFAPEITNLEPENLSEPAENVPEPSILAENGLEKSENPPEICCKGSNIAYMFDKMLSKNFKKVNGTQNVFYLRPESLLPKDKENQKTSNRKKTPTTTTRRKRYPTRGSSGMMYVDAAESMASFSELGDFSEELDLTQTAATTPAPTSINGASTTPAAAEDPTIPPTSSSSSSSDTSSDDDDEPPSRSSRRQDIHDDSEADESASRLRAESNVAGEVYEEYTGTNQPLFIQFNCSVNFNGRFNSFPICFLPTCVHQLLAMVDDPPTAPEDIADVEIVLELIVLTTQNLRPAIDINEVNYRLARMSKSRDTAMFYCKSINDNALFLETMSEKRELDPDCAAHIPSDDGSDFWIILTVDSHIHSIDVHFCQRYDGQHTDILDELWSGIRQELRTLNQESLLDMMYVQRRADKLLIAESRKIAAFEVEKSDSGIRTLTKKQQLKQAAANGGLVHEDLYYYFPERYFGCKLQREIWLEVPERVRNQSMHTYKNPLQTAFERIKAPLIQYAVHNRSDLFVYKDPETKQIFYFHLHMDADSYQLAIKGAEKKLRSKHLAAIQKSLETSICMTIFGIQEPSEDVVGVFLNALQDKLDGQLLGEIMKGYTQNMEQALSISEVQFLQPHGPPDIRQFFSIPFIFENYLSSLLFYIGQHIEALPSVSPAKVKENDIFYNGAAFNRAPVVPVWPAIRTRSFRHRLEPIAQLNLVQPTVQFSEKVERIEAVEEKVDQKVETPPQRIAIVPLNGPIPILQTQESEIEQAIEAVPELTPTPIPPPPEPETPPLDPAHIFRAETPFVGPVPADYLLNSFFVYHILPARGIVDTGIALIEFRICRPDGSLMTRFDQPAMNEQSHTLLVPNVPEDKATVYRDIIKSHVSHSPKPEKSICGHLEMIVWTKGDVVNDVFERMMYELIEQSMFDVITEFGYLNTTIVEEGALTGHVALTNRSSDAFLPGQETPEHHHQQQQPVRHLTKQGSASSVTASVDTRHTHHHPHHHHTAIPSHSGEMRRSLVVGLWGRDLLQHGPGSLDIPLTQHFPNLPPAPRTPAFRMPQIARELEQGFHQQDSVSSFRRQDYMNRKNAYSIIKWLDHVASRQSETSSVIKQRIRFEFQHASLPALFEIRNRLEVSLGTLLESEIRERVYLCGLKMPGAMQHDSTNESDLSIFGATPHEGRFEVLTTDPFHAMTEDTGVDESQNQEEYILVSCIRNVFDGFGENDIRTKSQVDSMRHLFRNHLREFWGRTCPKKSTRLDETQGKLDKAYQVSLVLVRCCRVLRLDETCRDLWTRRDSPILESLFSDGKYSPLVQTNIYAPRQRLMMAYLKGDFMTVYFYNYHSNIHRDAVDTMKRIVGFHNAKSRLLREIGLHKMGITHLSPFHTEPLNEYDYEVLIWTDPMSLISKEFPSEHKPPPAFMKEPQCSNIFFRMYRQPDLQTTMGRSKTLFKSECVKTMHYEQLLRWRAGLKTKLDFIQKVTRAHMEMLKRIPEINECDLLMFLRPPKVAKKLGPPPTHTSSTSSVRHRHCLDDDHHTVSEDNYSITERTSKRASILGESVKSQAIAESEIFKGKGEFLRKTEIKLGLAAEKFHEIRTPFFLRSDWNRDAPRRAGELFDEVVRESDIRSLLEEPLKEFLEISQVQKAKSTKLLMKKRKYSEKSVDVIVSNVVVKNEKRQIGEEEDEDVYDDDWSEVDSELEENPEETMEATTSSRMDSESRNRISRASVGEEDFQRTYGKVRRSWKTNPPGSPTPLDSRHNSFSSSNSTSRPSDPGAIEKMFSSTINAVSKLTRRLSRRTVEKEPSIERPEDLTLTPDSAPSPEPTDTEECSMEPAISPIMFKHAEEFSRYFCRKYGFIQFQVENRNRRSKSLNRYTTSTTNFQDLPYLVFYKALDGGVIFADLRYEIPEFVVSFYMYERAKSSSADYYMVDRMEALYWKESEELHTAANQLKLQDSVCFMTFNFDYHLRAVCTYIDGRAAKKKCLFGTTMNAFHTIERLLDFYQHDLILSKNLVAISELI